MSFDLITSPSVKVRVPTLCCTGVERRPEHPQEEGSDHGEEIGGVGGALFDGGSHRLSENDARDADAEISAEGVDKDRVAGVDGVQVTAGEMRMKAVFGQRPR